MEGEDEEEEEKAPPPPPPPPGGHSEPVCPRPEHLLQLREEIEALRERWVSAAVRQQSRWRRVVGRETLDGCLRELRQARRGWEALLLGGRPLPSGKQETLLNFLDLGLALLERIQAVRGRRRKPRGRATLEESAEPTAATEEEEEDHRPPRETRPAEALAQKDGGPEREDEDEEEEEDEDGGGGGGRRDRPEAEAGMLDEEARGGALAALRRRFEALQEGAFPRREQPLPPLHERRALRLDLGELALRKAIALDGAERRLRAALRDTLKPRLDAAAAAAAAGLPPEALGDFLWADARDPRALPAELGARRREAAELRRRLLALRRAPSEKKAARRWKGVAAFPFRAEAPLLEAARRAAPAREEGPPWRAVQEAVRALGRSGALPSDAQLAALQELVEAAAGALKRTSAEGAARAVREAAGLGGRSSREALARLGVPWAAVEALERALGAVWEALDRLYLAQAVEGPRAKLGAASRAASAVQGALRAAGLEEGPAGAKLEALRTLVESLPLAEMAALNDGLRRLIHGQSPEEEEEEDGAGGRRKKRRRTAAAAAPRAGPDPGHVFAGGGGGRSDPESSEASGPPFPAPTSLLAKKEGAGPGKIPPGARMPSGIPPDLGVQRSWHQKVTQEERQLLVQEFVEAIAGSKNG